MKKSFAFLSRNSSILKLLCIIISIPLYFSCEKDKNSRIDCEFQTTDIIYYPDKRIALTFKIVPEGDNSPFTIKWHEPDSLKGAGPFTIRTSKDLKFEFEVLNADCISKIYTHEIKVDTLDSLKYDYRNNYIGKYSCSVTHSYAGEITHFIDTLTVMKNTSFIHLSIFTSTDIKNKFEGNSMTYQNRSGFYNRPDGNFYGYHSVVLFSNDSIHYTSSGPLGYFYTNAYEGVKINQ